jgi:hypothetical protein
MIENSERFLSWQEFKEQYLAQVEYIAEILSLDRNDMINEFEKHSIVVSDWQLDADDDWKFCCSVMLCLRDCESTSERHHRYSILQEKEEAMEIFEEIYCRWGQIAYSEDLWFLNRRPELTSGSSEKIPGKVKEMFLLDDIYGTTQIQGCIYEDHSNISSPLVITYNPNEKMTHQERLKALRDVVTAFEAQFQNCLLVNNLTAIVPNDLELQAFLVGISENNRELHMQLISHSITLIDAMRKAGWLDPEVAYDSGIEKALQRAWPELHEKVQKGEKTPFEALIETGWIEPEEAGIKEDEEIVREIDELLESLNEIGAPTAS